MKIVNNNPNLGFTCSTFHSQLFMLLHKIYKFPCKKSKGGGVQNFGTLHAQYFYYFPPLENIMSRPCKIGVLTVQIGGCSALNSMYLIDTQDVIVLHIQPYYFVFNTSHILIPPLHIIYSISFTINSRARHNQSILLCETDSELFHNTL